MSRYHAHLYMISLVLSLTHTQSNIYTYRIHMLCLSLSLSFANTFDASHTKNINTRIILWHTSIHTLALSLSLSHVLLFIINIFSLFLSHEHIVMYILYIHSILCSCKCDCIYRTMHAYIYSIPFRVGVIVYIIQSHIHRYFHFLSLTMHI